MHSPYLNRRWHAHTSQRDRAPQAWRKTSLAIDSSVACDGSCKAWHSRPATKAGWTNYPIPATLATVAGGPTSGYITHRDRRHRPRCSLGFLGSLWAVFALFNRRGVSFNVRGERHTTCIRLRHLVSNGTTKIYWNQEFLYLARVPEHEGLGSCIRQRHMCRGQAIRRFARRRRRVICSLSSSTVRREIHAYWGSGLPSIKTSTPPKNQRALALRPFRGSTAASICSLPLAPLASATTTNLAQGVATKRLSQPERQRNA